MPATLEKPSLNSIVEATAKVRRWASITAHREASETGTTILSSVSPFASRRELGRSGSRSSRPKGGDMSPRHSDFIDVEVFLDEDTERDFIESTLGKEAGAKVSLRSYARDRWMKGLTNEEMLDNPAWSQIGLQRWGEEYAEPLLDFLISLSRKLNHGLAARL